MDKKYIIGAIVAVLVISFIWNRNNKDMTDDTLPVEEIITQEDGTVVKKTGDLIEAISPEELEAKKQEISEKLQGAAPLEISSTEGQTGSAKSYKKFEDGSYYHKIELEGMKPLQKGYFYQAWLEDGLGGRISIGRVEMDGETGEVYYSAKEDRSTYKTVVVSREVEDGNPEIGEVVLEGTYTE